MTTFQYKVISVEASSFETKLNTFGSDGWELVNATYLPSPRIELSNYNLILKKTIPQEVPIIL